MARATRLAIPVFAFLLALPGASPHALAATAPPRFGEVLRGGAGDTNVILVPCLGCDARAWDEFMERNEDRFRMFAVTWPGMGHTPLPELSETPSDTPYWDYVLEAMTTLLDEEGLPDAILMGHSAAGPYVVQYAAAHPERIRGVVTVDSTITNKDTLGFSPDERLAWARREFEDVLRLYDSDEAWAKLNAPPSLPDPQRSAFYGDMWTRPPRRHVLAYWRDWLAADSGRLISSFSRPLLALFAIRGSDKDPMQTRRERLTRYDASGAPGNVRVQFIADSGHSIWEWQPELFDRALAGFVEGLEWQEDLRYLAREMALSHTDLYHSISESEFTEAMKSLERRAPDLERHRIIVELAQIVASVGDGHTRLWLYPNGENRFRRYPIFFYRFEGELRVTAIDERYADAVGGRLLNIGAVEASEAFARLCTVTQRDNAMTLESYAPRYLSVPEVLHALDIIDDMETATFEIEDDSGRRHRVDLRPVSNDRLPSLRSRAMDPALEESGIPLTGLRARGPSATPLYLRHQDERFWFELLEAERTLFVQINAIRNGDDESLADFFARAVRTAETESADKLVIDLRHNGGGNNYLNLELVHELVKSDALNRHGSLFVIIGRHTFSAASHLVSALELNTRAILVGEPTGAAPNHYGDAPPIFLPHSGIVVSTSSLFWQNTRPYPMEERPWSAPQVSAAPSLEAFKQGVDLALEAIFAWQPEEPLHEALLAAFEQGGVEEVLSAYEAYRAAPRNRYAFALDDLLRAARGLRSQKAPTAALATARLALSQYPESPSAHEAVGDALRDLGDLGGAESQYRKIMEMAPRGLPQARARLRIRDLRREPD